MATPNELVELMHHKISAARHDTFNGTDQVLAPVAELPCYMDEGKPDRNPPTRTAYVGVTTTAPLRQGDYFGIEDPDGKTGMWSASQVQTWWDQNGGLWCQQVDLDCQVVVCVVDRPSSSPDAEGRLASWIPKYTNLSIGLRPLATSEQVRATQVGQQVTHYCRYPHGVDVQRADRFTVAVGAYDGVYEVVTIEHHDDADTTLLRRYEPSGTVV